MKKCLFFLIAWLLTLTGCTQNPVSNNDNRVAAVVNGVEITNRQVDYYFSKAARPGMSEKESAILKRRILADMIRLELLSLKGKEMKLDQGPDYALEIYMAQKKVLADMTQKHISEKSTKTTPQEADMVVKNNHMMFAGRHAFVYDEILISGFNLTLLESLDKMTENGATKNQILEELKAKKIPFRETLRMQYSEQIPKQILSILNGLKPGTPQVINFGNKASVILVLHESIPTPLTGEQAKRIATSMINQSRAKATIAEKMSSMVDNAKITYADEYLKKIDSKDTQADIIKPNPERASKKTNKKALIGSLYAMTFVFLIQALTAAMRSLTDNKFWLPVIIRKKAVPETTEEKTEEQKKTEELKKAYYIPYKAPEGHIILIVIMATLILAGLTYETLILWNKLETWLTLLCIAAGLVIGYFASRLYIESLVKKWSRVTYLIIVFIWTTAILVLSYTINLFSTF